ncbi:MAG: DUF262 domain-containing protein [Clostridia bacterium]|nr:DUF262 domain-containing protein [Clostridia bacterium]
MQNEIENIKYATRETFWSILSRYTISIPRMQRNYAQGREREINVTQKRETLLNDIFDALSSKERLDLNFIYGNVTNEKFIPIDGQQRLTTLFLLYWYFSVLGNKKNDYVVSILSKFTYETRDVTRQFCERLVKDVELVIPNLPKNDIGSAIKDYYWFFNDFEYDPSIASMLVMLQAINDKVRKIGFDVCQSYFDLLISEECPLCFLFLNIDDIGLTDEIYINMNARGKPLTEFENFKAQLTNYLSSNDKTFADEMLTKINCEWSQFFWAIQYKSGKAVFDDQIMNFIKFYMFNDYICNNNSNDATDRTKIRVTLNSLMNESTFEFTNRLFRDEFKNVYDLSNDSPVVNEATFKKIYKVLNTLAHHYLANGDLQFVDKTQYKKEYFMEDDYFTKIVDAPNFSGLGYENRVLLFAEYAFISKYSEDDGQFNRTRELTDWIRYIYNLSKAQLYNQQDDYYRSIRSINTMIENGVALNILVYASSMSELVYRQGRGFGFNDIQTKEEAIKAYLMTKSSDWKDIIIDAENSYLDNQISSIINFSGIEQEYDLNMRQFEANNPNEIVVPSTFDLIVIDQNKLELFMEYLLKIETFFNKTGLKKEYEKQSIFRRALLTFGQENSYLLIKEGSYSFLNNTHRDYGFRRLLRDDNNGKRKFFKQFLDSIDCNQDTDKIKNQMESLISSFESQNKNSWKYYFLTMPQILDCVEGKGNADPSGDYVFKSAGQEGRFINMKNKDEILLCEGRSTRSMNREFYSYVLYLKARELGYNVNYVKDFTENNEKYLIFTSRNNEQISIVYTKDEYSPSYRYVARKDGNNIYMIEDIGSMLSFIKDNI